jgi:hypothetical protein
MRTVSGTDHNRSRLSDFGREWPERPATVNIVPNKGSSVQQPPHRQGNLPKRLVNCRVPQRAIGQAVCRVHRCDASVSKTQHDDGRWPQCLANAVMATPPRRPMQTRHPAEATCQRHILRTSRDGATTNGQVRHPAKATDQLSLPSERHRP